MKKLFLALNFLFAVTTQAADQRPHNPLAPFVGSWIHRSNNYVDVIRIADSWSNTLGQFQTLIYGLDLYPQLGYRSSGSAEKDWIEIQENPDQKKIEGLLIKTINGRKELIEVNLEVLTNGQIKVDIDGLGQHIVRVYSFSEEPPVQQVMLQIQKRRTEQIFSDFIAPYQPGSCKSWSGFSFGSTRLECVRKLLKDGSLAKMKTPVGTNALVEFAGSSVEQGDVEGIKLFLANGGDPNTVAPNNLFKYRSLLSAALGNEQTFFQIGQHGNIWINPFRNDIAHLLLAAGARFSSDLFVEMLQNSSDPGLVEKMLNMGARLEKMRDQHGVPILSGMFINLSQRWGRTDKNVILRILNLQRKFEPPMESDSPSFTHLAIRYADVSSLEALKEYGYSFSERDVFLAETEISKIKKDLTDSEYFYAESTRQAARKDIARIAENLAFVRKNLRAPR